MSAGGTPPRPLAPRPLYPQVANPEDQRRALADAEAATDVRDKDSNAAIERRIAMLTDKTLEDVLEREIKVLFAQPLMKPGGAEGMRVSERTALITAGVKLLAVKTRIPPKTGEGLDEDDE